MEIIKAIADRRALGAPSSEPLPTAIPGGAWIGD
jgi:hypothetical protein